MFEKHLNWTSVLILIVGCTLSFFFVQLSTANYSFPWPYIDIPYRTRLIPVGITFLISLVGYSWVLKKKKRSQLLLLVFLPFIFFWLSFFFGIPTQSVSINEPVILFSLLSSAILGTVPITWVKIRKITDVKDIENGVVCIKLLKRTKSLSIPKNSRLISIIVLTLLLLSYSGYSYYTFEHEYIELSAHLRWPFTDIYYSFEYPASYRFPYMGDLVLIDDVEKLFLSEKKWYNKGNDFQLRVWNDRWENTVDSNSIETEYLVYLDETWPRLDIINRSKDVIESTSTEVNNISAQRFIITVPRESSAYEYDWGILEAVCFKFDHYVWIVSVFYPATDKYKLNEKYNHIVDTFEVGYQ